MMNQTQLKYARERAAAIKRRREEKLTALRNDATLDNDARAKALKEGRFEVRGKGYNWYDRVVFLDAPKGMSDKEYSEAHTKLREEYDRLIDELVLGDQDEALKMLRAFEAV
jgi:hypothetical protein